MFAIGLLAIGLSACGNVPNSNPDVQVDAARLEDSPPTADTAPPEAGPEDVAPPSCKPGLPEIVAFSTDDGVRLEADLYTPGGLGRAAVVLLHMIPPSNDRSNYPRAFIDALVASGFDVLNVDRRGAGGSEGAAFQAYTGPNGALDVKAAVAFMRARPCAGPRTRIALVGASNGTTSALDYAVLASRDATLPAPAAMVFLTGGAYTESQNRLSAHRAYLSALPLQFVFSTAERAWSVQQMAAPPQPPPRWDFREYQPGGHGTQMFAAQPRAAGEVAAFLATAVQ